MKILQLYKKYCFLLHLYIILFYAFRKTLLISFALLLEICVKWNTRRNGVMIYIFTFFHIILYCLSFITQKTEKAEKLEVKKTKAAKGRKESNYELPEIPDYERAVLEEVQKFDFGEFQPRDKTKLDRPATQVKEN